MKTKAGLRFLARFAQVGVFSSAIAALIWWLTEIGDFVPVLAVSLSIGWSILISFLLLRQWLSNRIGPWLAPVPIVAVGLAAGLTVGGTLVSNQPLFFFSQSFGTLGLGLFFGITGSLIFVTRERLRAAREQLAAAQLRESRQEQLLAETEL